MKTPSKSNFSLKKVKVPSTGGLELEYDLSEVIGGESYKSSQRPSFSKEPHPDLTDKLAMMAPMVAQIFRFTSAKDVVFSKEFDANISQIEYISKLVDEITEKIRVTGISISSSGEKIGVVITASYAVDNKQRVAMNTPRILLGGSGRGLEEKLEELVEAVEDEAFQFVYENKIANPEMFDYA